MLKKKHLPAQLQRVPICEPWSVTWSNPLRYFCARPSAVSVETGLSPLQGQHDRAKTIVILHCKSERAISFTALQRVRPRPAVMKLTGASGWSQGTGCCQESQKLRPREPRERDDGLWRRMKGVQIIHVWPSLVHPSTPVQHDVGGNRLSHLNSKPAGVKLDNYLTPAALSPY
ncbi:hypothetical protein VTO42DRAFT_1836 [Malbranchea cinnamomea]